MCAIDWGLVAAWIAAISTLGLLIIAALGLGEWKHQFKSQRDHDVALRVLRAADSAYAAFVSFRSPTPLITDTDVPVPASELDNPEQDESYRMMWARYRSRQDNSLPVVQARIDSIHEAQLIWPVLRDRLNLLGLRLNNMESQVLAEASKYVRNLRPGVKETESVDEDILFAPLGIDPVANLKSDKFAKEYFDVIKEIRSLLESKVRMD